MGEGQFNGDSFGLDGIGGRFEFSNASFAGVPGSGTTSSAGANTVTETFPLGRQDASIVYTAESSDPSLYQITSVGEGQHTRAVTPTSSSPTFAFQYDTASQTTTVIETINKNSSTETLTYAQETDGYALTQDTVAITNPSTALPGGGTLEYSFSSTGVVTKTVGWGSHTHSLNQPVNPTSTFTGLSTNTGSNPNTITETSISGDAVTTVTYVGSASAGYAVSQTSTTYIPADGAVPPLDVNPLKRAEFDFADDTVTWVGLIHGPGTPQSMTANSHVSYADLGSGGLASGDFVGETITQGSHSVYDLFYSSTGAGGEYMEVGHGPGAASAINLSGIAGQLTALNAVHTLVT